MELTENAIYLLEQRYLRKDENRKIIETPEELFRRVAHSIASVEKKYDKSEEEISELESKFYDILTSLQFLPNSPCLMNAGTNIGQLSACFVIHVDDNIESIMDGCKKAAIIHKSGGGTGFSFSNIRPKGDVVRTTGGIASGVVSFMSIYNATTSTIKQGGKRRGANMGLLRCDHPEIMDFITCKESEGNFSNFNISVATTKEFMEAVEKDKDIGLINPRTGDIDKEVRARGIWNLILIMAWRNGEPGVIFLDKINDANPTPEVGIIEAVNPCSEQMLLPFESCNLGSINLSKFIYNGRIQWQELENIIRLSVRFLDNVIDANNFPFKEIEEITLANRKIGLGIMGWADLLIMREIKYNSEEALVLARKIMKFISDISRDESRKIGKEKGSFPNKDKSIWKNEHYMRNAAITSIAPTGSISIISDCSSGIEPIFSLVYKRHTSNSLGKDLLEVNSVLKKVLKENGTKIDYSNIKNIDDIPIPDDLEDILITANEIDPLWHVKMQASFQKYVDAGISKTVNLPNDATIYDIEEIFMEAYKNNCKSITVYRDGSRNEQLLTKIESVEKECKNGVCSI